MMNLADKVIEANEQEIVEKQSGDNAPDGYYTDDLGFWVEVDIRRQKVRFAEYILFRCKKLNGHLHIRDGNMVYNGHTIVRDNPIDVAALADLPENISTPTAKWVYKRLLQDMPHLNRSKIEIAPGWLWDIDNSEIIKKDKDEYITVS